MGILKTEAVMKILWLFSKSQMKSRRTEPKSGPERKQNKKQRKRDILMEDILTGNFLNLTGPSQPQDRGKVKKKLG